MSLQIGSSDVLYLHRFMIEQWEFFETLEKGIYDCEIPIASFKVTKQYSFFSEFEIQIFNLELKRNLV